MGENGRKEWWDVYQVAGYLGWTVAKTLKWARQRKIPGIQQPYKNCKYQFEAQKVKVWAETLNQDGLDEQ